MKVVILVLTHQQPALLEQFVSLFPGPDFNFMGFVDNNIQIRAFHARLSKFSNVTFVKERHPVFWCERKISEDSSRGLIEKLVRHISS